MMIYMLKLYIENKGGFFSRSDKFHYSRFSKPPGSQKLSWQQLFLIVWWGQGSTANRRVMGSMSRGTDNAVEKQWRQLWLQLLTL